MRLVQLTQPDRARRVAIVDESDDRLTLLDRIDTVYALAQEAIAGGLELATLAGARAGKERASYDQAIAERRLLPPLDHPEPARFWITGTGLTHLGSAEARDKMHNKLQGGDENLTDSLKMFKMGLEGGKPKGAGAGVQPEWFYKGDGTALVPQSETNEYSTAAYCVPITLNICMPSSRNHQRSDVERSSSVTGSARSP